MRTPRRYDERCGVAHALDLVGQRWALLVVRELLLGPKRFTDLRTSIPHATPDLLSRRLKELQANGVIHRRRLAPPAASSVYELTPWGRELEPAVVALARWGSRSPHLPTDAPVGADSIMLGLRTFFEPERVPDLRATYRVVLGSAVFTVRLDRGAIRVDRLEDSEVDATIDTDPATLASLLAGSESVDAVTRSGRAVISGNAPGLLRMIDAVRLPDTDALNDAGGRDNRPRLDPG